MFGATSKTTEQVPIFAFVGGCGADPGFVKSLFFRNLKNFPFAIFNSQLFFPQMVGQRDVFVPT